MLVRAPKGNFVIDTSPDLREQLLSEKISLVEAALFTHAHADHIMGLDDMRIFGFRLERNVKLYCEAFVEEQIRKSFHYAFERVEPSHKFALPRLEFVRIEEGLEPFELCGLKVKPLRLMHGKLPIIGFRINDVAFCTDTNGIPDDSWDQLLGLDVLILDSLRNQPHKTHFSVQQAVAVSQRLRPKQTYLTHLSCRLDYEETNAKLPDGVELAWDGLTIPL